jgi:hypothetical protein
MGAVLGGETTIESKKENERKERQRETKPRKKYVRWEEMEATLETLLPTFSRFVFLLVMSVVVVVY